MEKQPNKRPQRSLQQDLKFYYEIVSQIFSSLFLIGLAGILADRYFNSFYYFSTAGFLAGFFVCYISVKKTIKKWFDADEES